MTARTSTVSEAGHGFITTQPGMIDRARGGGREALADLCRAYWRPIYVYFRARGCPPPDAEELTQHLFASLVVPGDLAGFDPARGRFRCWLKGKAWHLLLNELRRARAEKRGGGWIRVEVDRAAAEEAFQLEAQDGLTADQLFDRCWARTVVERVLARVRADCEQEGKGPAYARLAAFVLTEAGDEPNDADPATSLGGPAAPAVRGRTLVALRVERHRLRERLQPRCLRYLREEIGATVLTRAAIDDEIQALFDALG